MRSIMFLSAAILVGAGCTGGSASPDAEVATDADAEVSTAIDASTVDADAAMPPDAALDDADLPPGTVCNPVTQAGCQAGEKCAQLVFSEDPFLAGTSCVPDGDVAQDGACTRGEAGPNGYDDCVAGFDCLNGVCTEICDQGPPDTCGLEGNCTLFADLFTDNIGLCIPGCDPTDINACGEGFGCYLNATKGVASCAGVPAPAADLGQNEACYGPATGGCFLNGCASGFTPLLNNKPQNADGSVCARYCTPANTHDQAPTQATGQNGQCEDTNLALNGGLNGGTNHQCRFVQSFYSNTDLVPAEVGMCVPVNPPLGGTWGDCTQLIWTDIVAAWNGAVMSGTDPNEAFNQVCLTDPNDPMNADVKPECIGLFRGCLSLEEQDTALMDPASPSLLPGGAPFVSPAKAKLRDFVESRRAQFQSAGVAL